MTKGSKTNPAIRELTLDIYDAFMFSYIFRIQLAVNLTIISLTFTSVQITFMNLKVVLN